MVTEEAFECRGWQRQRSHAALELFHSHRAAPLGFGGAFCDDFLLPMLSVQKEPRRVDLLELD